MQKKQAILVTAPNPPGLVRIALPLPLRRQFDYLAPLPLPAIGCRVRVPFGRRELIGVVCELPTDSDLPLSRLKPVSEVLDTTPLQPEALRQLLSWAAHYYQHPLGEVWHHAWPVLLRQGEAAVRRPLDYWQLTESGLSLTLERLKRSPRQQLAWQLLCDGPLPAAELREQGLSGAVLQAMADKGWIEPLDGHQLTQDWRETLLTHEDDQPRLNSEQALVLSQFAQHSGFHAALLEGVTGSGKTEIYLQLIAPVLARGQQVLVLVPEIGLTPQTLKRFRRRFHAPILTLHSGMNDTERLETWLACQAGEAAILIGTRSALFTPFANLGLILVDEEHDASFKQQDGFRYHGRDLAIMRARLEQVPILLGSATPSLETLHNAQSGKYQHLQLTQRAGGAQMAGQWVIDVKHLQLQAGVSPQLLQLMQTELAAGNQVLLFLNRRGYAQALLCHQCGWIAACHRCDAYYTLHQSSRRLHCHHCDSQRPIPPVCPQCGSPELVGTGVGTEQLEQHLSQLFPQYPLIRIDRDSTRRKGELEAHLDGIRDGKYRILIGTQMLAKGHHFPDVTLVGLLDVDGALFSADFRATERLAQLYTQVAGRAGRASKPGRVILQSHHPEHLLLQDLIHNGYGHFARTALQERKLMGLPPFAHQALIRAEATQQPQVDAFMQELGSLLRPQLGGVQMIGPVSAPMARRAGKYRLQLLLQASQRPALARLLNRLLPAVEALPSAQRVRWSLDVDPQELF
ncbi:primosomal protein N' [Pseudaeromonas paramecii]|uniref:Replication restart protein PriA n=1 Tax=Pseudaeromonas paramecii TaxID=2138166 RepID=A0ABP8QJ88_9GAMM